MRRADEKKTLRERYGDRACQHERGAAMLTPHSLLHMIFSGYELNRIGEEAKKACLGGRSHVREEKDREENLFRDQVVGMLGNYVGSIWLTGSPAAFYQARDLANEDPSRGDMGMDLPGLNVDFKTSWIAPDRDPLTYKLAARPAEVHPQWIYVLATVVWPLEIVAGVRTAHVTLVGWANTEELPPKTDSEGTFSGAYTVPAVMLHPLMPFEWSR